MKGWIEKYKVIMKRSLVTMILLVGLLPTLAACSVDDMDEVVSDVETVVEDSVNVGDFEVKKFISEYFETIRKGDIDKAASFVQDDLIDLNAELVIYQILPSISEPDDEYAPLSAVIQDFNFKVSSVIYPDEDSAQVTTEIENVDVYKVVENALSDRKRDELMDGGLNEILIQELEKKYPKISVSVTFDLKRQKEDWLICAVNSSSDLISGISGNMSKIFEELPDYNEQDNMFYQRQESLNRAYEKMFGENGIVNYDEEYPDEEYPDGEYSDEDYPEEDDYTEDYSEDEYSDDGDYE